MKTTFRKLALTLAIALPVVANSSVLDLTGQGYFTYGNTNSYSLPLSALQYDALYGGGVGPGNPFYINSTPGAIKDTVVIYTGSNGTGVTTNVAGFEDAYGVPNGKTQPYAFMNGAQNVAAPTTVKAEIANKTGNSWDASVLAMKGFLGAGGKPIFLFNNNDTNEDQTLAIWARIWITDANNAYAAGTRSLYLTNRGLGYDANLLGGSLGGIEGGNATLFDGGNAVNPFTGTKAGTDFVRAGGAVGLPGGGTVNHNLGANQVAYAGVLPLLDQWLADLIANNNDTALAQFTMHMDLRMGCNVADGWGAAPTGRDKDTRCDDVAIDNGYEQLFMVSSLTDNVNVPEPETLALIGLGLLGLAASRRRKAA